MDQRIQAEEGSDINLDRPGRPNVWHFRASLPEQQSPRYLSFFDSSFTASLSPTGSTIPSET